MSFLGGLPFELMDIVQDPQAVAEKASNLKSEVRSQKSEVQDQA